MSVIWVIEKRDTPKGEWRPDTIGGEIIAYSDESRAHYEAQRENHAGWTSERAPFNKFRAVAYEQKNLTKDSTDAHQEESNQEKGFQENQQGQLNLFEKEIVGGSYLFKKLEGKEVLQLSLNLDTKSRSPSKS